MKTKTYFAFRVDVWDGAGDNIVEHVAGVDDFETAVASSTVMPSIEQMREHLAQAERHIAELQRQIDRQRQLLRWKVAYAKTRCRCSRCSKTACRS